MSFSDRQMEAVIRVGALCSSRSVSAELGHAVLDELRGLVDFAAASLSAFDPSSGHYCTVANAGYDAPLLDYLETGWTTDREFGRIYTRRWPDRMDDVPYDFRATGSYLDHLGPAGFEEGMTTCLFAADGRYTGALNLNVVDRRGISDDARYLIGSMNATLAQTVDLVRSPSWLPMIGAGAWALGVTRDARPVRLADRDPGPLLAREPRLHELASEHLRSARLPTRLLWHDADHGWRSILLVNASADGSGLNIAVIVDEPTKLPHALTARELDVLTLLSSGHTNREIAERLVVSERTVATHIEHLLEKLGRSNRAGLAGMACADGLVRPLCCVGDTVRRRSLSSV